MPDGKTYEYSLPDFQGETGSNEEVAISYKYKSIADKTITVNGYTLTYNEAKQTDSTTRITFRYECPDTLGISINPIALGNENYDVTISASSNNTAGNGYFFRGSTGTSSAHSSNTYGDGWAGIDYSEGLELTYKYVYFEIYHIDTSDSLRVSDGYYRYDMITHSIKKVG